MKVYSGGCSCGAVRFSVDRFLYRQACHCDACKKHTGSAYGLSVMVENDAVKEFVGETKTLVRIGESGKAVHYEFCPSCGTTVRWRIAIIPGRQVFAGGAFDAIDELKVVGEMYTATALPWARLGFELSRSGAPDDEFRNAMIAKTKSAV
jgi:hypothetical protein